MKRLISDAVQLRAAPTEEQVKAAALTGSALTAIAPTEREVRDALARLSRQLEDLREEASRKYGRTFSAIEWDQGEVSSFIPLGPARARIVIANDGEISLRGMMVIRSDNA